MVSTIDVSCVCGSGEVTTVTSFNASCASAEIAFDATGTAERISFFIDSLMRGWELFRLADFTGQGGTRGADTERENGDDQQNKQDKTACLIRQRVGH